VLVIELVGLGERQRQQLASDELVDRGDQQLPVARELLRSVAAPARVDHGRQVVGRHMSLDELSRRLDHILCSQRVGAEVVQHDHVEPACGARRVRLDVGGRRPPSDQKRLLCDYRNIDGREDVDTLRLAVFEDLEVLFVETADKVALPVHRDSVDFHVAGFDFENHRRGRAR